MEQTLFLNHEKAPQDFHQKTMNTFFSRKNEFINQTYVIAKVFQKQIN